MKRFLPLVSALFLLVTGSVAQPVFRIDSLPPQGVVLDKGWKFHAGDNPEWAKADFDDSKWANIDPTKDIFDLPQIPKTGRIGWFRLRLALDTTLARQLMLQIQQSGASEVYLNGRLIHRFGRIGKTPAETEAFTPNNSPVSFPVLVSPAQVLAVRYALQPGIRYGQHFGPSNPGLSIRLNRTEAATSAYRQSMLSERGGSLYAGSFGILALLFLTFFLFFPTRRESLYFAVFCLCLVFTWSIFYYIHLPANVRDLFVWKNSVLIAQAVGYLFLLLSVYTILGQKLGWIFWSLAALAVFAIYAGTFFYPWGWLVFGYGVTNLVNLDATRVALLATRRGQKGARIIVVGGIIYMIAWLLFCFQFLNIYTIDLDLFSISILSIPASYAIYFGYDFGMTNRSLRQKLTEVETLSAEKEQILATENDRLEQQVQERTAELVGKNRELEIEAALEKIRSRSLGMHHSVEIKDVVAILLEKLKELHLVFDGGAAIHLFTEGTKNAVIWVASPDLPEPFCNQLPYDEAAFENNPIILDVWKAKETGQSIYNKFYSFNEKNRYFDYVFKHNDFITIPQPLREFIYQTDSYTASFIAEKNSLLGASSWTRQLFSDNDLDVLKRVARVFEQAYIRFLDLQKAEAQTREAQIEAALERVRARAMAMKNTGELAELIDTLQRELAKLDFTINNCIFWIMNEEPPIATWWVAPINNTSLPESYRMPFSNLPYLNSVLNAWKERIPKWIYKLEGQDKKDMDTYIFTETDLSRFPAEIKRSFKAPDEVYISFSFYNYGGLHISSLEPHNEEQLEIINRFSKVFDLTYTRFLDLQKKEEQAIKLVEEKQKLEVTLTELRTTQAQLIQKEKLASLGELTAGVAHEIQNPLNFVNNFSEVSAELIEELEEEQQKTTRDTDLEKELLSDLKQNLQKIHHHGGRASSIVKGMLEHARTTTGERQPTDLNALADEYLRLAYQGLRAKDKTASSADRFNCELVTSFDPNLGVVEVVPQEIGRVLLNLFNNAFYAVRQRDAQADKETTYVPTVWVSTHRLVRAVEIRVQDNGTGIPDSVKDKIFQPFFTTKPTGEGTGLGLSLSYDIITKGHGGTLTAESQPQQGTVFIISLPLSSH